MDLHVFGSLYGWSKDDVLALTPGERAGLLRLIEEQIQRTKLKHQMGRDRRG